MKRSSAMKCSGSSCLLVAGLITSLSAGLLAGCATSPGPPPAPRTDSSATAPRPDQAVTPALVTPPSGETVADTVVATRVENALAAVPELSNAQIAVEIREGHVTLRGDIKSLTLRRKAESVARGVAGVRSVSNQLVITG